MAFRKVQSGNPMGRRNGIPDKRTALRAQLEPHAEKLIKRVVEKALKVDMTAMRLCLERLIPPMKNRDATIVVEGLAGVVFAAQARIVEVDELEAASGRT